MFANYSQISSEEEGKREGDMIEGGYFGTVRSGRHVVYVGRFSVCVCVCVCVCVWVGSGVCFTNMMRVGWGVGGGVDCRSLIGTDGFVNLQERPLRFGLSVNQTNSVGTAGGEEGALRSGWLILYGLNRPSMRNHRSFMHACTKRK
jgi:hypothetical protein